MANFARRIVSGNKARFVDDELDVELDLVYVTDRVIIMGFPAEGVEALYRNDREDTRKFLEHRHGQNYWIFNFCPLTENSYPAEFFGGHVSRYPFPDHHAPPLAILALATREMDAWLRGDPERVIVLHCKAGKGRSGTLACSYLLSLEIVPSGPKLERSHTRKEWANRRAAEMMAAVISVEEADEAEESSGQSHTNQDADETISPPPEAQRSTNGSGDGDGTTLDPALVDGVDEKIEPGDNVKIPPSTVPTADINENGNDHGTTTSPPPMSPSNTTSTNPLTNPKLPSDVTSSATSLDSVLALHSARRMKAPTKNNTTPRKGVSIPSQRRYLFYWSQMLSNAGPDGLWGISIPKEMKQQVKILSVSVTLKEVGSTKAVAMKVVNKVLEKTSGHKKRVKDVWVSLGRYDDQLVGALESWEKRTRTPGKLGRRRTDSDLHGPKDEASLSEFFDDGKWDSVKMVKTYARFGAESRGDVVTTGTADGKQISHTLHPLPQSSWVNVAPSKNQSKDKNSKGPKSNVNALADEVKSPSPAPSGSTSRDIHATEPVPASNASTDSVSTISAGEVEDLGHDDNEEVEKTDIIVDANREIRAKLHNGQVPMGWFWFIPAFHITSPQQRKSGETVHLKLKRSEIDFPLGPGSWIVEVDVAMQWMDEVPVVEPEMNGVGVGVGGRETSIP